MKRAGREEKWLQRRAREAHGEGAGVHAPHSHALLLRKDSSFLASVKSRVSGICQKQILGIY